MSNLVHTLLLLTIFILFNCKTISVAENKNQNSKTKLLKLILENYPNYRKLKMSFQLTGELAGQELYYVGELYSESQKEIRLIIKEPIFKSPLVDILWNQKKLIFKNEIKNKRRVLEIKDDSRIKLLGQNVSARLLFLILQGLPGMILNEPDILFNQNKQSFQYKKINDRLILVFDAEGKLKKTMLKDNKTNKITIMDIYSHFKYDKKSGKKVGQYRKKKKRIYLKTGSFHRNMRIYNNYSEDYIKIQADQLKIQLN